MPHTDPLQQLIDIHADELRALPHPSARRAKGGATLLGYARHHVSRGSTGSTLKQAIRIVREGLGTEPRERGRPPTPTGGDSRVVRLHSALDGPLTSRAESEGRPLAQVVDALLGACEVVEWRDRGRLARGSAGLAVRVSAESAGRFRRTADMSCSLAVHLGVPLG